MTPMGRPRKHNKDMPARVYLTRGWWFFVPKGAPAIKLAKGDDKPGALRAYAEIMDARPRSGTIGELLARYARDVMPGKAPKTQQDQTRQIDKLTRVFGAMRITDLTPAHVAQYLDASPAKVAANRERAILSHAYTKAMRWGLIDRNPCKGVERNAEKPRTRYISHEELLHAMDGAPAVIQVMIALAYITGQREGDLLKLRRGAITAEGLMVQQGKTGKRLLITWTPALRWAIEQAGNLPKPGTHSLWIVAQHNGQPYTSSGFQTAWQKHIRGLHERGEIAERFTFHDLRAKAGSDAKDGRLLGHLDPATLRRVYLRKPERVAPTN